MSRILRAVASAVGLEGILIVVGGALVAVGSSYVSPAGPWLVVGGLCLAVGVAVAVQSSRRIS